MTEPFRIVLSLALSVGLWSLGACGGPPPATGTTTAADPPVAEADVAPGINRGYLDPDLSVDEMLDRFEVESREIFSSRTRIARACGFETGDAVADVGAGTGLFTFLFAQDVGPTGRVFAVDISDKLVEHIRTRAAERNTPQIEAVLGSVREVPLAEGSVDGVFVCDTYHHFNHPMTTLASLFRALRPGGDLIIIDFERIPGVSREWVLGHVRAGKEVFRSEIESAGFEFVEELAVEGLEENYFLRFRRP